MGDRYLIAAGTARYKFLPEQLQRPQLSQVVEDVAKLFVTRLKYTRVLREVSENPGSKELLQELDRWFGSHQRNTADWLAFYYTAHGELQDPRLYLYASDTQDGMLASTTIEAGQLASALVGRAPGGEKRRVRNCLLILDTCHSTAGVFAIFDQLRAYFDQNEPGQFYIIAAALPRDVAQAGALARALIAAVEDKKSGGEQQPWLSWEELDAYVNQLLWPHVVFFGKAGGDRIRVEFFPNPRFVPGLPATATVEQLQRAADLELKGFWLPASRGIEIDTQEGWYFSGRQRVLEELAAWLADPTDHQPRIVTGAAGSGKSAILGMVALCSDPHARESIPPTHKQWLKKFPARSVDIAIYAKGKTTQELVDRIAEALQVAPNEAVVLQTLANAPEPAKIVIDALDEAIEPAAIVGQLLRPLYEMPGIKLLVGTRPEYLEDLGAKPKVIAVDQPPYLESEDVAQYVTARLMRSSERAESPYAERESLAQDLGLAVAKRAGHNFLIARMVAEDILAQPQVIETPQLAGLPFPDSVIAALERFLARFGPDEARVRAVLTPLAWAAGRGLPWPTVWPALVSALGDGTYNDEDIRWVLKHGASFIVQTLEQDRTVYRLYHQALADCLRGGHRDALEAQARIVNALERTVPRLAGHPLADWRAAHPYIRSHFVQHAGSAGVLSDYLLAPLFMLAMEPEQVLEALRRWRSNIPARLRNVYYTLLPHLRQRASPDAAAYLQLRARQNGVPEMAAELESLDLGATWRVPWVNWQPGPRGRSLNSPGNSEIGVLSIAEWLPNHPAALVGHMDGSVQVLDLDTGALLGAWFSGQASAVQSLSLVRLVTGPLLVVAWMNGFVGTYNLKTHEGREHRAEARITAICPMSREGAPSVAIAYSDGRMGIRSLPDLEPRVESRKITPAQVTALELISRDGIECLIAGTDSMSDDGDTDRGMLYLIATLDLAVLWEGGTGVATYIEKLSVTHAFGTVLVAVSDYGSRRPTVWDMQSLERVHTGPSAGHGWLQKVGEKVMFITFDMLQDKVTAQELYSEGTPRASFSHVLIGETYTEGTDESFRCVTSLRGRVALLTTSRSQVMVWDLEDVLSRAPPDSAAITAVRSLASHPIFPDTLYVGTYSGFVAALDSRSGREMWRIRPDPSRIAALASDPSAGRLVAAVASGTLVVLDAVTGSIVRSISTGGNINKIATARWLGRPIVLVALKIPHAWVVRIWDLESGNPLPTLKEYSLALGEEEKTIDALTAVTSGQDVLFAFASSYGKVMVGRLSENVPDSPPQRRVGYKCYDEWHISPVNEYVGALAVGEMNGKAVLVAGTHDGRLKVWDWETGTDIALRENAHRGKITALAFQRIQGYDMLVSAGLDGQLRFWSKTLQGMHRIDIASDVTTLVATRAEELAIGTSRGIVLIRPQAHLGDGPPGAHWKRPYRVTVADALGIGQQYDYGFASLEEGLRECQRLVDEDLERALEPGMSSAELYRSYTLLGRRVHLIGDRDDTDQFDDLEYARDRAAIVAHTEPPAN